MILSATKSLKSFLQKSFSSTLNTKTNRKYKSRALIEMENILYANSLTGAMTLLQTVLNLVDKIFIYGQ